jgi:hypothetical protein
VRRLKGPPSAVRVVLTLAMFSAMVSIRTRWAVRPEAAMLTVLKKLFMVFTSR